MPPSRQGPVAVVQAVAAPATSEDGAPSEKPREALERDLTEVEKVNYSELNFVENLGSGEFGQVFRGFYRGEEVAIKQLYWDDTFTDGVLQDLAKEIESFRHLRHKRLVRFIGACLEMPHPCLVTQYMPGGSLHHLLHARKVKLPALHATNMCLQLSDGVLYLHSQTPTVVHRDLKSLNVVLDLNLNIKICDFGLTESMERTHITKRNNGGSPRYMAPELFDCKTKITEKIDVWAMGCIFVEIFGGPLPYESINTLADLTREMLVHRRKPDVPEFIFGEIRSIISRCLDFDHCMRFTSKQTFESMKAAKRSLRQSGQLEGRCESQRSSIE
jgi:serine/threonine protein kinase